MRNTGLIKNTILALGLMISAAAAHADNLDLTEGTMTTGGHAQLKYDRRDISDFNSDNLAWGVDLSLGYFVMDNLSVDFAISSGGHFTDQGDTKAGLALGAHYYFNCGSMVTPYVGVMPGIEWQKRPTILPDAWVLKVPVYVGALIGLNSHVALDFGLSAALDWELQTGSAKTTNFQADVGYVGVRAFF